MAAGGPGIVQGLVRPGIVTLFVLAACGATAAFGETRGTDLLRMARAQVAANAGEAPPSHRSGFFAGYVRALYERGNGQDHCGPPCGCDSDEAVIAYLEAHPDELERPARELVDAALRGRFPCPR